MKKNHDKPTQMDIFQGKEIDTVLEIYRQAGNNMRTFVDIRFKHFTTYIAIMVLLAACLRELHYWKLNFLIALVEVFISILFNLLDNRTKDYISIYSNVVVSIERRLQEKSIPVSQYFESRQLKSKKLSASIITKLIFGLFILVWVLVSIFYFIQGWFPELFLRVNISI